MAKEKQMRNVLCGNDVDKRGSTHSSISYGVSVLSILIRTVIGECVGHRNGSKGFHDHARINCRIRPLILLSRMFHASVSW